MARACESDDCDLYHCSVCGGHTDLPGICAECYIKDSMEVSVKQSRGHGGNYEAMNAALGDYSYGR